MKLRRHSFAVCREVVRPSASHSCCKLRRATGSEIEFTEQASLLLSLRAQPSTPACRTLQSELPGAEYTASTVKRRHQGARYLARQMWSEVSRGTIVAADVTVRGCAFRLRFERWELDVGLAGLNRSLTNYPRRANSGDPGKVRTSGGVDTFELKCGIARYKLSALTLKRYAEEVHTDLQMHAVFCHMDLASFPFTDLKISRCKRDNKGSVIGFNSCLQRHGLWHGTGLLGLFGFTVSPLFLCLFCRPSIKVSRKSFQHRLLC